MSLDLEPFSQVLQRSSGLVLRSVGTQSVINAIQDRIKKLGLEQPEQYLQLLDQDTEECQRLIEVAVVPETWFCRDPAAFEALTRFVRDRVKKNALPVRVLCIPCSTGEEPYTVVATLTEAGLTPDQFVVDAIDISHNSLSLAQKAVYREYSFRKVPEEFRQKYFTQEGDDWKLTAEWRQQVRFRQGNLFAQERLGDGQPYDFIFCRNLLIYFCREDQARALNHLRQSLAAEGILFVGPGEGGVVMAKGFRSLCIPHAFAFRMRAAQPEHKARAKAEETAAKKEKPARPKPADKPAEPARDAKARPAAAEKSRKPESAPAAKAAAKSKEPAPAPKTLSPQATVTIIEQIKKLADSGDMAGAEGKLRGVLAGGSNDPDAFYLMGLLQDAQGDVAGAIGTYRKVLYLDPNHHEAMTHMALLLDAQGNKDEATRLHERAARIQKNRGKQR